jgi:hypothetical protein
VTPLFTAFCTVAVNFIWAASATVAVLGLMVTTMGTGATVTVAVSVFVLSAALIATTVYVPGTVGLWYVPPAAMVPPAAPPVTVHCTVASCAPVTVAVKSCVVGVALVVFAATSDAVFGVTATVTSGTTTSAEADCVASATLVAVTR